MYDAICLGHQVQGYALGNLGWAVRSLYQPIEVWRPVKNANEQLKISPELALCL